MSVVYWDTMLFVYWFEGNAEYTGRLQAILSGMDHRGDRLVTSAFTVGELLVGPKRLGDLDTAGQIQQGFQNLAEILPFTFEVADHYGAIRANHRVSPADAIHLASAAHAKVDLFLTNDRKLIGKVISGIQFVAGLDVSLY